MFGRRKRKDAQAIDAIREHVTAADIHARAVLADAIAQMELRLRDLEERAPHERPDEAGIEPIANAGADVVPDLARVLEQVANMCAHVAERLEDDRLERRALTEALTRLARPASAALEAPTRMIGGTVFGAADIAPRDEISLLDDEDDEGDDPLGAEDSDAAGEESGGTSDYVLTVLERLTDVAYRQKERDEQP